MFLTFWLRTENKYFNVDTDVAELEVFKKELKTKFVPNKDQLISGRFSNWYLLDGALSRQQSSGGKSSDSNSCYQFENLFQLTNLDGSKLKDTNDMELFVNHQSLHNNFQKLATWKGRVLMTKKWIFRRSFRKNRTYIVSTIMLLSQTANSLVNKSIFVMDIFRFCIGDWKSSKNQSYKYTPSLLEQRLRRVSSSIVIVSRVNGINQNHQKF